MRYFVSLYLHGCKNEVQINCAASVICAGIYFKLMLVMITWALCYRYSTDNDKFVIYDLRSHNYDKLIREALSGYRLILLFVDEESKQKLVRRFAELMMPFNR